MLGMFRNADSCSIDNSVVSGVGGQALNGDNRVVLPFGDDSHFTVDSHL